MTFQAIRAHIETSVNNAYQALSPAVPVVFDNVQETPPDLPYVVCLVSYTNTTVSTVCVTDGAMEQLNGNLQLSIYVPRGPGMKALEDYATTAMVLMNNLYDWGGAVKVKAGSINGPVALLDGDEPYALATISCPFIASVEGGGSGSENGRLYTRDVVLTNPKGGTATNPTSAEDYLTRPVAGITTQEDANEVFDKRLKNLEDTHDDQQGHDGGNY